MKKVLAAGLLALMLVAASPAAAVPPVPPGPSPCKGAPKVCFPGNLRLMQIDRHRVL